jgi:flavodoxin
MKTLIVYHSLTGNCKKVAGLLSQELSADLEPIEFQDAQDLKDGKPAGDRGRQRISRHGSNRKSA